MSKVSNADKQKITTLVATLYREISFQFINGASFFTGIYLFAGNTRGSMMMSHANDAYFWMITKFLSPEMNAMLKVYSVTTIFMGLITLLYILSLILLK